jgi:hypothetical protein
MENGLQMTRTAATSVESLGSCCACTAPLSILRLEPHCAAIMGTSQLFLREIKVVIVWMSSIL